MYELSPDSRSVSSCSSGSNTDELPVTQGKLQTCPTRARALGEAGFFCQEQEEWVSEREREARQIDKTGVCLIAIKNFFFLYVSPIWLLQLSRLREGSRSQRQPSDWCQAISNRRGKDARTKTGNVWLQFYSASGRYESSCPYALAITSKTWKLHGRFSWSTIQNKACAMSKILVTVISLALHACALALHSKACVGVAMALPVDMYHFLCGTWRYPNIAQFWTGHVRVTAWLKCLATRSNIQIWL